MRAGCTPIHHLHDPGVTLSLHTAALIKQHQACTMHPNPSHRRKQLTHPCPIRFIIHLLLQIVQFVSDLHLQSLKTSSGPLGTAQDQSNPNSTCPTTSVCSSRLRHVVPTFPQPRSCWVSPYELVHGGYFPNCGPNIEAVPHDLQEQGTLLEAETLRTRTDRGCCLPPLHPSKPTECLLPPASLMHLPALLFSYASPLVDI